jgi:enterochelin esterase-like enzyme
MRHLALLLALLPAPGSPAAPVLEVPVTSTVFGNRRVLQVLLPPGYSDATHRERRYPVVYFTDGVAAFDAWGVPEVAARLWREGRIPPAIFVAIPNGGSVPGSTRPLVDRASEFLPYDDQTWEEDPRPEPRGNRFPQFMDEVRAAVRGAVRVSERVEDTCLAGASYGAVAVLYAAMKQPHAYGCLLVESPSLHVGNGRMRADLHANRVWPARIYVGVGTEEGDSVAAREDMVSGARALLRDADSAPDAERRMLLVQPGGTHWFDTWRSRLPRALEFLLGAP